MSRAAAFFAALVTMNIIFVLSGDFSMTAIRPRLPPSSGEVARHISALRRIKETIPYYEGAWHPKAEHYQAFHAAMDAAVNALSKPTPVAGEARPDEEIRRRAQHIVEIANKYEGYDGLALAKVPVTVLRAAAMIVNGAAFAPLMERVTFFSRLTPDEAGDLRQKIALVLINERRRFYMRPEAYRPLTSLAILPDHQTRDELRYADAILAALSEAPPPPSQEERP